VTQLPDDPAVPAPDFQARVDALPVAAGFTQGFPEDADEFHRPAPLTLEMVCGGGRQHEVIVMRSAVETGDVARAHIRTERESRFAAHLVDEPRALHGVQNIGWQ